MTMKISLCSSKADWNNFVDLSPQNNVFCSTPFLDSVGVEYELWFIEKNGQAILGAIVLLDDAGRPLSAPYSFTQFQGILFSNNRADVQPHHFVKNELRAIEFLLSNLESRYSKISFCLHPHYNDLRSFSWFHYHEPERGQFQIDINYTGWINLGESTDFENYLSKIRQTRRYEYRKALKEGMVVEVSHDVDTLMELYRLTFRRQGVELDSSELSLVRSISTAALSQEFGELQLCRDRHGSAISATLFLYDSRFGYYLIGANHPDHRQSSGGTFLFLENLRACMERGVKFVDVCGMNSPNRGDFKTSFNAKPVPYFVASWEAP